MTLDRSEERKAPLILFYSYAHTDELLRNELEKHLSSLQRQGIITGWHDRKISAGSYWAKDIDDNLNSASIILLLISPDFLASDYCYSIEMQQALRRHERGEAHVIPVILRPVYWQEEPLRNLQALPRDGKPITTWSNQDEAFLDVVRGIREVVNQIRARSSPVPPQKVALVVKQDTESPPDRDHWEEGGAQGELVGSLVRKNQWAQAEAAARGIVDSRKRSLVLCKLVNAMIRSEQWIRAEAIAFSIEELQYKRDALIALANGLIDAQQWTRARSVIYGIEHPTDRSLLLRKLSRDSGDPFLAYDSDVASPSAPSAPVPAYEAPRSGALPPSPGYEAPQRQEPLAPPRSRSRRGFLLPIAAVVVVVLLLLLLLLTKALTGALYFAAWGIIGVIAIYIIVRIISFIRRGT
jgi:hypothetical protein